ncbi:DUF3408 domain-containing protein [Chitinophaga sp. GbtcB8]|uniref:DUF3408 domain-containing protein n=1 Tax=Chitinophaga sp. GbtcB8 TaxID=2824753 RepID=UPI001C2F3346|nr:DUF3408 domain-containing protein [Chitinophaga sp. GbtcB8]
MAQRGDKCIYVRPEYHERISCIVQVIGSGEIPLYAYLDNILKHHFDLFEEDILKDFAKMSKPLFSHGNNNCHLPVDCDRAVVAR